MYGLTWMMNRLLCDLLAFAPSFAVLKSRGIIAGLMPDNIDLVTRNFSL